MLNPLAQGTSTAPHRRDAHPLPPLAGEGGGGGFPKPKWKGQVSATYDVGQYSATARVRFVGEAKLDNAWDNGVVDDNTLLVEPLA